MKKFIETLDKWIENSQRKYADGLALFEACATETQKKEYLAYFKDADPDEQTQFSQPMTILTNKLVAVKQMMQVAPENFKDVKIIEKKADSDNSEIVAKQEEIDALQSTIEELTEKIENSEDDNSDLQDELDDKEAELDELKEELEALKKKRGIQIVAAKDLPKSIQKLLDRNKAITPLMASIHAEIANESTPEEKRKELVKQLCDLDDERRAGWDKINQWAEGNNTKVEELEEKPLFDSDPILAGLQIARRIERVKENLARSKKAIETAKNDKLRTNAENRVAAYQTELDELEKMLPNPVGADAE